MSKHQVIVLKIIAGQISVTEAAAAYAINRQHLHRLLKRYREGGLAAIEPRSRKPRSNPRATPAELTDRIVRLRTELTADGLDAGPVTIAMAPRPRRPAGPVDLHDPPHPAPPRPDHPRTHASGPESSYIRFEADAAQRDAGNPTSPTGALADGTDIEILNWLDDHSRYLLACTAHRPVTGDDVVTTFPAAVDQHGTPPPP